MTFVLSSRDLRAIQRHYKLGEPARAEAARAFLYRYATDALEAARRRIAKCTFEDCQNDASTGRTFKGSAMAICEGCWTRLFGTAEAR